MKAIINATLVMTDHYIPDATLIIEDGKILDFGRKLPAPENAEIIDAKGLFVGPGLIDIHTHADGTTYFHDDPVKCSRTLLDHGVTSVLPALFYSMNKEEHLQAVKKYRDAMAQGECKNLLGLYMEGPYLNPDFGCDKEKNFWKDAVCKEDYAEVIDAVKDLAKVWCIAPEREGILDFVKDVKEQIPGIVFSVAHSEASPQQIEELMPYGLKLGTHHTNATGTLENYPEVRGVCVDETVNYNDGIYAELICDSMGIHVHPYMIRLVKKIKGQDKIILISDAFVADGPPIPGCEEAFDINFDWGGDIAGSKLTLDIACRNMMVHTGGSICDVFKYASYNPSKLLNIPEIGQIRKGNLANLIIVDQWFNVKNTILKGEIVK
ncbi:MAG: amidohydrolase family protein [Clostridia bacterium]|nr:amidohydrolase family protein [Clostridia bacterium]